MASVSMADISIKGDAYLQYADNGIDESGSKTKNTKRVNLKIFVCFIYQTNLRLMHQDFLNPNVHRQDWSHYAHAAYA
jgi:hypothetical protein